MFLLLDTKDSGYCSCIPNNTNNFTHKPKKTSSTLYEAFFHQLEYDSPPPPPPPKDRL